jgi:glycogen debranching enzyme
MAGSQLQDRASDTRTARKQPGSDGTSARHGIKASRAASVHSITSALVAKDEDLFFLCEPNGQVPLKEPHGVGLYYHDCRFLNGYELHLDGSDATTLLASGPQGFEAELILSNNQMQMPDGSAIQQEDLGIRWQRVVAGGTLALHDRLTAHNFTLRPLELPLSLTFSAAFEDLFTVRGQKPQTRGRLHPPAWHDGVLTFAYDGSDGVRRTLDISFSPEPDRTEDAAAHFRVGLAAGQSWTLDITLSVRESPQDQAAPAPRVRHAFEEVRQGRSRSWQEWLDRQTRVQPSDLLLEKTLNRSLHDLRALRSELHGHHFFAAGVPWYVTLFGRDSILAAFETLAYEPQMAADTLRRVARYQGTREDEWRDEQPGKIMHELRVGEWARTNKIPQTPYYGTIDATPLFLILLAEHARWTGSLDLFDELRDNVERALRWMADYGDPEGMGYLAYQTKSSQGLGNQGWKDSGDAIVNADGTLATPPIALAEVQGYVFRAKRGLAELYRRAGDAERAGQLDAEAADLARRFDRDFWLEDKGIYALALQKGGRPAAVATSNAGQVLWSGIAEADKARRTAERLLAEDMFSGWGIRTLSARERRYNPLEYHLGTVWPHDNALILAGLCRYGLHEAALRVFEGITEAACHFPLYRLPEVFAGLDRREYGTPVRYPVACHPQAWAAGAVPFMLVSLLGLAPEAFAGRLHLVRPVLPAHVRDVELAGLRVGSARVDLSFQRAGDGRAAVEVLKTDGPIEVPIAEPTAGETSGQ